MRTSIIFLNYNSAALLKQNLEGLLSEGLPPETEVILVDNGEKSRVMDGEINLVDYLGKNLLEGVLYIKNKANIGFGAACNAAAYRASGEVILFLNPDCFISGADIQKMVDCFKSNPRLGAIGPKIINNRGGDLPWSYGGEITRWGRIFLSRKKKNALIKTTHIECTRNTPALTDDLTPVVWISGACMMVRKEIFERNGGFDERFFMYFEDQDLCMRIAGKGFRVARLLGVSAVHLESKSGMPWNLRKKIYYKSQGRFFLKHYGILAFVVILILRLPRYVRNVYFKG